MDTRLAITSRRETRRYAERDLPADVVERILDAGRLAGSAKNRQPWVFVIVEDESVREELAELVFEPENVRGARLVVAIAAAGKGPLAFDTGRAAQNMLLAAWDEGVGSSPNGLTEPEEVGRILGLAEGERPFIVLTFGYPQRRRDPASRTPAEWSESANRKPLAHLVRRR